jgi:hypothetical protein
MFSDMQYNMPREHGKGPAFSLSDDFPLIDLALNIPAPHGRYMTIH